MPVLFADVIVAYRNGAPVQVRDVGRHCQFLDLQPEDWGLVSTAGRPRLLLVRRQPGANTSTWSIEVNAQMPLLQAGLPSFDPRRNRLGSLQRTFAKSVRGRAAGPWC